MPHRLLVNRWVILLLAFVLGTLLDLGSKAMAFVELPLEGDSIRVNDWFAWTHARNEGAAFGLFKGKHTFFTVVTLGAFVAVPYFVHTARERIKLTALILGLILAGVMGNFWDRMVFGYVRDFIDVHTPPAGVVHDFFKGIFNRTIWPTFNVADIFITAGAVSVVLFLGRFDEEEKAEGEDDSPQAKEDPPPAKEEAPEDPPQSEASGEEPSGEEASDAEEV